MKKNAVALRAITHAHESFAQGDVILGMDAGQFSDWSAEGVDMVREATAAEVAKARGEKPAPAKKPARSRAKAKPKVAEPAPTPAADAPSTDA